MTLRVKFFFGLVWFGLVWFGLVWFGLVCLAGGLRSLHVSQAAVALACPADGLRERHALLAALLLKRPKVGSPPASARDLRTVTFNV